MFLYLSAYRIFSANITEEHGTAANVLINGSVFTTVLAVGVRLLYS